MSASLKNAENISKSIARIQAKILAFVMAFLGGLTLFLMTAWLIIKGGVNVGEHLQLLQHYFPGYSVTWGGSFIGFFYGSLIGGIAGWATGFIYNRIVNFRHPEA